MLDSYTISIYQAEILESIANCRNLNKFISFLGYYDDGAWKIIISNELTYEFLRRKISSKLFNGERLEMKPVTVLRRNTYRVDFPKQIGADYKIIRQFNTENGGLNASDWKIWNIPANEDMGRFTKEISVNHLSANFIESRQRFLTFNRQPLYFELL